MCGFSRVKPTIFINQFHSLLVLRIQLYVFDTLWKHQSTTGLYPCSPRWYLRAVFNVGGPHCTAVYKIVLLGCKHFQTCSPVRSPICVEIRCALGKLICTSRLAADSLMECYIFIQTMRIIYRVHEEKASSLNYLPALNARINKI